MEPPATPDDATERPAGESGAVPKGKAKGKPKGGLTPKIRGQAAAEKRHFEDVCLNAWNQYVTVPQICAMFSPPAKDGAVRAAIARAASRLRAVQDGNEAELREVVIARVATRNRALAEILYAQKETGVIDPTTGQAIRTPLHEPDVRLKCVKELRAEDQFFLSLHKAPAPAKGGDGFGSAVAPAGESEKTEAQTLFELLGIVTDPDLRNRIKADYNARRGISEPAADPAADEWKPVLSKPNESLELTDDAEKDADAAEDDDETDDDVVDDDDDAGGD